jgi:hypothetical protein
MSDVRGRVGSVCLVIGALALASHARAQDDDERWTMAPRLYAFGQLGLFGDVHLRSDDVSGTDALEPSGGAGGGFEIPLAHVFSIGGELSGWGWNSDGGSDYDIAPSFLGDLSIVPRFRVPWSTRGGAHGAVGLALPIGPTLSVLSEDIQDGLARIGASTNTGYGMNLGAMLNGQFFVVPAFGFTFDVGYQHHFMWHEVRGPLGGERQVQLDMGQLVMRAGIVVAL